MKQKWEIVAGGPFDDASWVGYKSAHWWVLLRSDHDGTINPPVHLVALDGIPDLVAPHPHQCGEFTRRGADGKHERPSTLWVPKSRVWARMPIEVPEAPNIQTPAMPWLNLPSE